MLNTAEAVLQTNGAIEFLEPVHLAAAQRVLVTFTGQQDEALSGAQSSERSLSVDWLRAEEDAAWAHLQPDTDTGPSAENVGESHFHGISSRRSA